MESEDLQIVIGIAPAKSVVAGWCVATYLLDDMLSYSTAESRNELKGVDFASELVAGA